MTDDSYPPEWDASPPPDPMDPRLGSVLDAIRPTSAERALVADLFAMYVARDPDFATTYQHLYVNLTQDHCDGLIRDHLGEEVVAQASS